MTYRITLRVFVKECGKVQSDVQELRIAEMRTKIKRQLAKHQGLAQSMLPGLCAEDLDMDMEHPMHDACELIDSDDEDGNEFQDVDVEAPGNVAECIKIALPSTTMGGQSDRDIGGPARLRARDVEIKLRIAQCNDALDAIRLTVGKKAYIFRSQVRKAKSKKHKTRAYTKVHAAEASLSRKKAVYDLARRSLVALNAGSETLEVYQELTRQDLRAATHLDSSLRNQKHKKLAWFWTMDDLGETTENQRLHECKCSFGSA